MLGFQSGLTSCHQHGTSYHQFTVASLQRGQEPQHDDRSKQNRKAHRQASDAYTNRFMTIDIECLSRPEEQDREKVGATDEGDDQSQEEDAWSLLESSGKHRMFGTLPFPYEESHQEEEAEE